MDNPEPAPDPRTSAEHEMWARYYACRSFDEDSRRAIEQERMALVASDGNSVFPDPRISVADWRDHQLCQAEYHLRLAKILHGLEELYR